MGLILDTSVIIASERGGVEVPDLRRWEGHGEAFLSAITVSELLVGVHLAGNEARRARRESYVEAILGAIPVLDFTAETARIHAGLLAALTRRGGRIGAHDLLIAATALAHGHAVLTENPREFHRVPGLEVLKAGT